MRTGTKHSEETKRKMKEKSKKRWENQENIKNAREKSIIQWSDPLARQLQSERRIKYCKEHPESLPMNSIEARQKISDSSKRFYSNPEEREKQSIKQKEYHKLHPEYVDNKSRIMKQWWIDHPEQREIQSRRVIQLYIDHPEKRNPGPMSKEACLKISRALKHYYSIHPQKLGAGRCHGRYFCNCDGIMVWLRSTYEVRYAGILNALGIKWDYECKSFYLIDLDSSYRPDFYLVDYNTWVEVKGYMTDRDKTKLKSFQLMYPEENLIIVYIKQIQELEHELKCYAPINILDFGMSVDEVIMN